MLCFAQVDVRLMLCAIWVGGHRVDGSTHAGLQVLGCHRRPLTWTASPSCRPLSVWYCCSSGTGTGQRPCTHSQTSQVSRGALGLDGSERPGVSAASVAV